MNCENMTKKEFLEIPMRKHFAEKIKMNSLVILPGLSKDIHDSGFRNMDFVAINRNGEPICRLSGGSDVIHMGGISIYGENAEAWTIDCLPKSGLLRLFLLDPNKELMAGEGLSSFCVYAADRIE